jgi:deazaflavin-dependent oxidoreductase (nitroreductase family)
MTPVNNFSDALKNTDEIEITVTGRASNRKISNPVWFVQEEDKLYLLPVKGSDSDWFKNILKNPSMRIAANGSDWNVEAIPLTDQTKVREIADMFRRKYGADQVKKYYSKIDVAVEVAPAGSRRRSA